MAKAPIDRADMPTSYMTGERNAVPYVVPAADPLIIALHVWDIIATRTYNCLIVVPDLLSTRDPATVVAPVDLRLRHIAALEYHQLLRIPNFGRKCYYDLAAAMERFGWRWPNSDHSMRARVRDEADLKRGIVLANRLCAQRYGANQRNLELLRMHEKEGLSVVDIAHRLGVSKALIHGKIARTRATEALRARYALPRSS